MEMLEKNPALEQWFFKTSVIPGSSEISLLLYLPAFWHVNIANVPSISIVVLSALEAVKVLLFLCVTICVGMILVLGNFLLKSYKHQVTPYDLTCFSKIRTIATYIILPRV